MCLFGNCNGDLVCVQGCSFIAAPRLKERVAGMLVLCDKECTCCGSFERSNCSCREADERIAKEFGYNSAAIKAQMALAI